MNIIAEPRKIAHQIISVRENICNELMEDLGSVRNENNEAARIAGIWARESLEEAVKSRRPTRMSDQGSSTPHRDKNFYNIDLLVCFLSLYERNKAHIFNNEAAIN